MMTQPLLAGFLGGWEILIILGLVTLLGSAVVISLVVIALTLTRRNRAANPTLQTATSANRPSPRRS